MKLFLVNNSYCLIILAMCFCGCSKEGGYVNEIVTIFEKGTDSTYERIYVKNRGASQFYFSKSWNTVIYETKTRDGNIGINARFSYSNEEDMNSQRLIVGISTEFILDDISTDYGHYFDFENGRYAWRCNNSGASSYICNFDNEGKVISEEGSLLVDYFRDMRNNSVNILYSTVFYDIDSVFVSSPKMLKKQLSIQPKFGWQPLLSSVLLDFSTDSVFYIESYSTRIKGEISKINKDTFYVNR